MGIAGSNPALSATIFKKECFKIKFIARVNNQISAQRVRTIDVDGTQLGVLDIADALNRASERGEDLVEIAQNNGVSVCKIIDYGKYKYEKEKLLKENKKKQKSKEVKIKPHIGEHDFLIKRKKILDFIEEGKNVKVILFLRGRQRLYVEKGLEVLDKMAESLTDLASMEKQYSSKQLLISSKTRKG